jgi:hypothetical protein
MTPELEEMLKRRDAWKRLVQRYADGRAICNCGHAYYITGTRSCEYGCEANIGRAKEELAWRIEQDLNK